MAIISQSNSTFLSALSDFWTRFFADKDQLDAFYEATGVMLGQAYLDLMSTILNISARECPIWQKEFWRLLLVREDQVIYRASDETYLVEVTDQHLKGFQYLYNKIFAPTQILEKDINFRIENADKDYVVFLDNPFNWEDSDAIIPGVASRMVEVDGELKQELAFWIPDAKIDNYNLYLNYGHLLDRFEPSSESYRALLRGIMRYFVLGPTAQCLTSTLNVISGYPVIRDDGEILQTVDTSNPSKTVVRTDRNSYEFDPLVPLRSDVLDPSNYESLEFEAFESLTVVFQVHDSTSGSTWWYDLIIPKKLLPDESRARRTIDPNLYENKIGYPSGLVKIGDPGFYIGADDDGFVPTGRPSYRHSFAYLVFERFLRHHCFLVIIDPSAIAAGVVPFARFQTDLIQIIQAGRPAYTYLLLEPEIRLEDTMTMLDGGLSLVAKIGSEGQFRDQMEAVDNQLRIGLKSWKIGDYFHYVPGSNDIHVHNASTHIYWIAQVLAFEEIGYSWAVPTDIGKPVSGSVSGATGILANYVNISREWWVTVDHPGFLKFAVPDVVTIIGGTGAGTVARVFDVSEISEGSVGLLGETPLVIGGTDPTHRFKKLAEGAGGEFFGTRLETSADFFDEAIDVGRWIQRDSTGELAQITEVIAPDEVRFSRDLGTGVGQTWYLWEEEASPLGGAQTDWAVQLKVTVVP